MWADFNSLLLTDGYKPSHRPMYPIGTTKIYSNFTPRSDKHASWANGEILNCGIQKVLIDLDNHFRKNFFSKDKMLICREIATELAMYNNLPDYNVSHVAELWDYQRLPITVRAFEEGAMLPIKVPSFTVENTVGLSEAVFHWITNYLETILSCEGWLMPTAATIALEYRKILTKACLETNPEAIDFVKWQAHDFSMRGMGSLGSAINSGLGHALVFDGSDTLPVIPAARFFYDAKGFVIGSVPATEHSVMCAGSKESEIETYLRLMRLHPFGILSIVSDTWDLWQVLMVYSKKLRQTILRRGTYIVKATGAQYFAMEDYDADWNLTNLYFVDEEGTFYSDAIIQTGILDGSIEFTQGKIVFRPDSGDPVKIVCGNTDNPQNYGTAAYKGVIEILADEFGFTESSTGYKVLHPAVGCIYGDSITLERCQAICTLLKEKGFASTNIVFGVGSFTYQYNTRDSFGWAMKATYSETTEYNVVSDHEEGNPGLTTIGHILFKDPITDDGTKKSAFGLLKVIAGENGKPTLLNNVTKEEIEQEDNLLKSIFVDGRFTSLITLEEIRAKVDNLVKVA